MKTGRSRRASASLRRSRPAAPARSRRPRRPAAPAARRSGECWQSSAWARCPERSSGCAENRLIEPGSRFGMSRKAAPKPEWLRGRSLCLTPRSPADCGRKIFRDASQIQGPVRLQGWSGMRSGRCSADGIMERPALVSGRCGVLCRLGLRRPVGSQRELRNPRRRARRGRLPCRDLIAPVSETVPRGGCAPRANGPGMSGPLSKTGCFERLVPKRGAPLCLWEENPVWYTQIHCSRGDSAC